MEILGQKFSMKDVGKSSLDALAVHQVLHHFPRNTKDEKLRIITGLTVGGIGYVYGPEIHEKFNAVLEGDYSELKDNKKLLIVGGTVIGAVTGAYIGSKIKKPELILPEHLQEKPQLGTTKIDQKIENILNGPDSPKHGISKLLLPASVIWLGYSLMSTKDKEDSLRQRYMVGLGTLGYLVGPELLFGIKDLTVNKLQKNKLDEMYQNGSALTGLILGGAAGGFAAYKLTSRDQTN